jgi:hypothetical protein
MAHILNAVSFLLAIALHDYSSGSYRKTLQSYFIYSDYQNFYVDGMSVSETFDTVA